MDTLIVMFRLRDPAAREAYEAWARDTDLPVVRSLPSVGRFDVYRVAGLYTGNAEPPYDYVEVIDLSDRSLFRADVAGDQMRRVAAEFRQFADNPVFLLTRSLEKPA